MHLKFRRLLSESLERRQLFSADLGYQFGSFDRDQSDTDFGAAHFQQFVLVRGGTSSDFSPAKIHELTNSGKDISGNGALADSQKSVVSNAPRPMDRGPRGRLSGDGEYAPLKPASQNSTRSGNTNTPDSSRSQNPILLFLGQVSQSSSVQVFVLTSNQSSVGNPGRTSAGTTTTGATNTVFQNSAADPHATLPPVGLGGMPGGLSSSYGAPASGLSLSGLPIGGLPSGGLPNGPPSGSSRSLSGYFDSSSSSKSSQLTETQLQLTVGDLRGQSNRRAGEGIASRLGQALSAVSMDPYHQASTEDSMIDVARLAESMLSSKLSSSGRAWKLSEQSIKNLKSLSRDASIGSEKQSANSDIARALSLEKAQGFIDVTCRRDPIARIASAIDTIEVTARLESKIGLYQVFDLIHDHNGSRQGFDKVDATNSLAIAALESIDWNNATIREQGSVTKADTEQQGSAHATAEQSSGLTFGKSFFITSVLAVFSGQLLRSRRKKTVLRQK